MAKSDEINFTVNPRERDIINQIVNRAWRDLQGARHHDKFTKLDLNMDITAVHCNGNPLRLEALRDADDFNFTHDILGIRRHLNRDTGKLENHFRPRFSEREAAAA